MNVCKGAPSDPQISGWGRVPENTETGSPCYNMQGSKLTLKGWIWRVLSTAISSCSSRARTVCSWCYVFVLGRLFPSNTGEILWMFCMWWHSSNKAGNVLEPLVECIFMYPGEPEEHPPVHTLPFHRGTGQLMPNEWQAFRIYSDFAFKTAFKTAFT